MTDWRVFKGTGKPHDGMASFAASSHAPPWRRFKGSAKTNGALSVDPELKKRFSTSKFLPDDKETEVVNAAIHLRRPLLVTGKPGTGKTTLAHAVAHELMLGTVLNWPITSRSTLQDGLYRYDAIARLQDANLGKEGDDKKAPPIGRYIRLGALGTALLPSRYPRVLLIDEIDKSDIDLPNDLLHVFEEGSYEIPELTRISAEQPKVEVLPADSDKEVEVVGGRVACDAFPIVFLTSNGEREFPGAFLRRCVRLNIPDHGNKKLAKIVDNYFSKDQEFTAKERDDLIKKFLDRRDKGDLSTDQLLNAIYLSRCGFDIENAKEGKESLIETIWRHLSGGNA
jgi:MoxR-like ATPase